MNSSAEAGIHYTVKPPTATAQQLAARTERQSESPADVAERVLRGEVRVQELKDRADVQLLQDDVAMVGQGRVADRTNERLGRSGVSVIVQRKIWEGSCGRWPRAAPQEVARAAGWPGPAGARLTQTPGADAEAWRRAGRD